MVVYGPIWPVSKDPKRPNISPFIARDPQNCPSSHKKSFCGINRVYKAVGSNIDRTSCIYKASTK
jgi:hypothetical protein